MFVVLTAAPALSLALWAAMLDLPEPLRSRPHSPGATPPERSVRYTDRDGVVLRDVRTLEGFRARPVPLAELGERLPRALLAAEDRRFYRHFGLDPLAMARAVGSSLAAGRVTSGASTLTQQLARTLTGAPRTRIAKLGVMALALRIEASLDKDAILEAYLNHVEFGPKIRGAEAASRWYFDKAARDLSLGEAAALASIPRGPTLYDARKEPERLTRRRDRVLDRMLDAGLATPEEVRLAKAEPIATTTRARVASAPHLVAALERGDLDPCGPAVPIPLEAAVVTTSLLAPLQAEVEEAARSTIERLAGSEVSAASVVVVENATGEVLAYVGSPDATDAARLGGNDGVRAPRQPGSSLKPFVYELAMERLGFGPHTVLPDLELSFPTQSGVPWRPHNYDERFHGPVTLREALGNSLNVPAVWTADRVGVEAVLERLRKLGFCSLERPAADYGLGLALGDGEVRLLELARAYAALARGGTLPTIHAVRRLDDTVGRPLAMPADPGDRPRVLGEREAYLTAHVLRDPRARQASFGEDSVLELPFEAAAKTGTSKGFRDNVAVGFTSEVTVAVWVGNFDGRPMRAVSGVMGAGPLFRASMLAAAKHRPPEVASRPDGLEEVAICPLSGGLAGPNCPHRREELAHRSARLDRCDVHVELPIDPTNGLLAGPACADARPQRFERFAALFAPWARASGRPLPPTSASPRCPEGVPSMGGDDLRVIEPHEGARYFLDPGAVGRARLRLVGRFPERATVRAFVVDGVIVPADIDGHALLELRPGNHTIAARADEAHSEPVRFVVR